MAGCFSDWLACMRACSRLPGTADQIACAADCDLELARCIKDKLFIASASEAVYLSKSLKSGLALPLDVMVYDAADEDDDKKKKKSGRGK